MALTITPSDAKQFHQDAISLKNLHTVDVTSSTYTILDDNSGNLHRFWADCTITLPAVNGGSFIIQAATPGIDLAISPAATDYIMGGGDTAADDKDLQLTSMSAGDYVWLIGSDPDGYRILVWSYTGSGAVTYLA